jgi:glutamate carboxypeptidase
MNQPFAAETLLAELLEWVAIESPTHDRAAVNRMLDRIARDLAGIGAAIERRPGQDGYGDVVAARLAGASERAGVLVLAHADTVHELGTLAGPLPIRREDGRCYGPGICDMKGGTFAAFAALRAIASAGTRPPLPVTLLVVPDEEVGSPSSRAVIEAEARRHRYVLVPEPARGQGFTTGRHAIARFLIDVHGRPAHAGANPKAGRSAIREMARLVPLIEGLADEAEGSSVSVGIIRGGSFVNVVPTLCRAEILVMAPSAAALERIRHGLAALEPSDPGLRIELRAGPLRPVWQADAGGLALYAKARELARAIGLDPDHGPSGGGSDGNFTGALGIPTLDGLGVEGGGIHTKGEHLEVASLGQRARLLHDLLLTLD